MVNKLLSKYISLIWYTFLVTKGRYRLIDFNRLVEGKAYVLSVTRDPNRTGNVALILCKNGEITYVVAPDGISAGMQLETFPTRVTQDDNRGSLMAAEQSSQWVEEQSIVDDNQSALDRNQWSYTTDVDYKVGDCLQLSQVRVGAMVHNVEQLPGKGAVYIRAAGTGGVVLYSGPRYAVIKLPSGKDLVVLKECRATIGKVGNVDHFQQNLRKAGASRWLGRRPHVRGVAMNPIDHPMGGGEGKSSGGRPSVSPWGVLTKGYPTKNPKRKRKNKKIARLDIN